MTTSVRRYSCLAKKALRPPSSALCAAGIGTLPAIQNWVDFPLRPSVLGRTGTSSFILKAKQMTLCTAQEIINHEIRIAKLLSRIDGRTSALGTKGFGLYAWEKPHDLPQ